MNPVIAAFVGAVLTLVVVAIVLRRFRAPRALAQRQSPRVDAATIGRFVTDLSHELRTPLTLILGPVDNALDGVYGEVAEPLNQQLKVVRANALRIVPAGGTVDIRIRRSRPEEVPLGAVIEVADDGPGIPTEALPRLFDRLFRVPGRESSAGAGIGLALAHELVLCHGGELSVESTLGKGTTFFVRLPSGHDKLPEVEDHPAGQEHSTLASDTEVEVALLEGLVEEIEPGATGTNLVDAPPENDEVHSQQPADPGQSPSILLVDDHPQMRRFLIQCLGTGYRYTEAADGVAAIELLETLDPDLMIIDVVMPRMDGFGLCRHVRQSTELDHLPIMMLTARAELQDRLEGLAYGADDYLAKPFARRELCTRVANLITRRKQLRERVRLSGFRRLAEITATPLDEAFLERAVEVVRARMDDPDLQRPLWISSERGQEAAGLCTAGDRDELKARSESRRAARSGLVAEGRSGRI